MASLRKASAGARRNQTTKTKKSDKCDLMADIFKESVWLFPECDTPINNEDQANNVIKKVNQHINSNCTCVLEAPAYLLIANANFEIFHYRFEQRKQQISEDERYIVCDDESEKPKAPIINDIPENNGSKMNSESLSHLLNVNNLSNLIDPLKLAIIVWNKCLALNKESRVIVEETLIRLDVIKRVIGVYHAFGLFSMPFYQVKATRIMEKFIEILSDKYDHLKQTCYYCIIKSCFQLGAIKEGNQLYNRYKINSLVGNDIPNSFPGCLLYLIKCEVKFLNDLPDASKMLIKLINSEYLSSLTVNRYYIKGLALQLASRFPNSYNFSRNFSEFNEPVQIGFALLKRWNCFLLKYTNNTNDKATKKAVISEPLWFKFGVAEFCLNSFITSAYFFKNIQMTSDILIYFNPLLQIARHYNASLLIAKILLVGAQIDYICDHKESAIIKLLNAFNLFTTKTRVNLTLTESCPKNCSKLRKNQIVDICSDEESDLQVMPRNFTQTETCSHQNINIKEIIKHFSGKTIDDNVFEGDFSNFELESNVSKDLLNEIPELDLLKTLINAKFVIYANQKNKIKNFENFLTKTNDYSNYLLSRIKKEFSRHSIDEEKFKTQMKTHSISNWYKLDLIKQTMEMMIQTGNYCEAIQFRSEHFHINSFYDYFQRMTSQEIEYLSVFCHYMNQYYNEEQESEIILEYENQIEENIDEKSQEDFTPINSPVLKSKVPFAPKHKADRFQMDEMKDYIDKLKDVVYDEQKKSHAKGNKKFDLFDSVDDSKSTSKRVQKTKLKVGYDLDEKQLNKIKTDNATTRNATTRNATTRNATTKNATSKKANDLEEHLDESSSLSTSRESIKGYQLEHLICQLHQILKEICPFPPVSLYQSIQRLLFKIYVNKQYHDIQKAAYHFAESTDAISFRYRCMFTSEKKKKFNRFNIYEDKMDFLSFRLEENCQKRFEDRLPLQWTAVQMAAIDNGTKIPDLLICRYENGNQPIFIKIKGNSERYLQNFMVDLTEIIQQSNASVHNRDKETFWRLRIALDNKLFVLLKSVENAWFGPFRGILLGKMKNKFYKNTIRYVKDKIISLADKSNLLCKNQLILQVVIESLPILKFADFASAIKTLFVGASNEFIKKSYDIFIEKFSKDFKIPLTSDNREESLEKFFKANSFNPVCLILDKSLELFSFEALPCLVQNSQSLYRMPSLRFLNLMLETYVKKIEDFDENKVFYLLDPENNLKFTGQYFSNALSSINQWTGFIGKPPEPKQLRDALENQDVYMFFGHGAGSTYYKTIPDGLDSVCIRTASIVMGCSSGKLFSDGSTIESYGSPYRFLLNGAPCYVGCLWDVTDKDIDKFSNRMLNNWLPNWKNIDGENESSNQMCVDICSAVNKSRNFCKLKSLIGASCVVYGLPVMIKQIKK